MTVVSAGRLVRVVLCGVAMAGVLAGCGGGAEPRDGTPREAMPPGATAAAWFEACPGAASGGVASGGTVSGGADSSGAAGGDSASAMPDVSLPCIRPGDGTDFGDPLGVPTVVNVWASWCEPCREELPAFQSYADRVDGTVQVLGVVSGDRRDAAVAWAKDLRVRFPTLFDEKATLTRALGRTALPVTLFIDADGRLAHLYNAQPLTERSLSSLVERHLGVRA